MNDVYSIASLGLHDGQKRLETISQNAASASVPGFRRQVAVARPFSLDLAGVEGSAAVSDDPHGPKSASKNRVDLRMGQLIQTARGLDVAIETEDVFFALSDGVQTWLTRAGAFRLDADGVLVGERGLRVQGVAGDVKLDHADVEIRADGQILRDGVVVGALQLFKPNNRADLEHAGGTLLRAAGGVQPATQGTVRVRGGALESSNAAGATEMIDLLTISRQFESLVRVTQGYDELLGRTIQKLGEV